MADKHRTLWAIALSAFVSALCLGLDDGAIMRIEAEPGSALEDVRSLLLTICNSHAVRWIALGFYLVSILGMAHMLLQSPPNIKRCLLVALLAGCTFGSMSSLIMSLSNMAEGATFGALFLSPSNLLTVAFVALACWGLPSLLLSLTGRAVKWLLAGNFRLRTR